VVGTHTRLRVSGSSRRCQILVKIQGAVHHSGVLKLLVKFLKHSSFVMPRKPKINRAKRPKKVKKVLVKVANPKPKRRTSKKRTRMSDMNSMPMNCGKSIAMQAQQSCKLTGVDFMASALVNPAVSDSKVLTSYLINPAFLVQGSRLATEAQLWEKYRFKRLEIVYETSVAATNSGSFIIGADPDVLDDYTNIGGDLLLQKLGTASQSIQFPVWQNSRMVIDGKKFFGQVNWVNPESTSDPRNVYAGRIWIATMGGLGAGTFGRFYIRWTVEFISPSMDADFASGTAIIQATTGSSISSTYPWGDFSNIPFFVPASFVSFYSDAVLGSVIRFESAGVYIVNIVRTGTAMGTGAFTSAVFNNCTLTIVPTLLGINNPFNISMNNGGSTSSSWTAIVMAKVGGATMSSTNDAGVTHTFGAVFVSRLNNSQVKQTVPAPAGAMSMKSLQTAVDELQRHIKSQALIPTQVLTETASGTISEVPAFPGEPVRSYTTSGSATLDQTDAVTTVAAGFKTPKGYVLVPK